MDDLPEVGLSAVIENLKQFTNAANEITKSYDEMARGGDTVEQSSSLLTGALTGVSSLLTGALVAAAAAAVAAIVALAAGFAALSVAAFNVSKDMESASNATIIGTGASGEALEEMEGIVKNLSESSAGVGHSYETMGKVVAEVNTRLGLSGDALENASAEALKFSRVTGVDAVRATQLATRVMGDWGIENENLGGTLDTLFGASQAFGISTDSLAQKVVQFGAPLRQMGFSFEESIALFGKWEKEGVNAELAIGSLRIAAGKFARENVPLREGLEQTMEAIKGASSESEALALGMEVFGARAGPDMTAAIREGRFELESAIQALQGTQGALDDASGRTLTFGDKMEIMWNKVRNSLLPFGDSMLAVADKIMPILEEALVELQPAIAELAEWLGTQLYASASQLIPIIKDNLIPILRSVAEWVINEGVPALMQFATWIYTDLIPAIQEWYKWFKQNIWPIIVQVAKVIKDDIIPAIADFAKWISNDLIPAIKEIWKWIDKNLLPIFEDLFKSFSKDGKKAGGILTDIWEDISKALEPLIEEYLPELLELWDEIVEWTKRNWPKIQKIIEDVMKAIQKKIDEVLTWLEDFWEDWGETILAVTERTFGFIVRTIKRNVEIFMDIIELALDVLTGDWEGAWQKVLDITQRIGEQIKDTISTIFGNVKDIIANALRLMIEDVSAKLSQLKSEIQNKFNEIKSSISSIWNSIKDAVVNAVNSMMQAIVNTIGNFAYQIKDKLNTVVSNAVSALLSAITGGNIASLLLSVGQKMIEKIANAFATVTTFAEKLRTALSDAVQKIIDNFGTLGTTLKNLATSIIAKIGGYLALAWDTLKTYLQTTLSAAVGSVWSGATSLLNSIKNIGSTIVTNIGSAISSNFYKIKSKLKEVVEDLVKEALSWLGINSPSSLTYDLGVNMAKGLALGLKDGASLINSGLANLVSAPLIPAPISAASAAGQSINNQTFNVGGNTINSGMDSATFEARVMDVIRRNS